MYTYRPTRDGQKLTDEYNPEFANLQRNKSKPKSSLKKVARPHSRILPTLFSLCTLAFMFSLLLLGGLFQVNSSSMGGLFFAFIVACITITSIHNSFNKTSIKLQQQSMPIPSSLQDTTSIAVVSSTSPPIANKAVTIIYQGAMAANATNILMHWGYNNWNSVTDTQMTKQSDGTWHALIAVPFAATSLNMTFCNQSNQWDNNNNNSYQLTVLNITNNQDC
ncbi:hypothetical protein KDW_55040 [Dictyobacter vulcani]|uniref:Carbohydrate binding module family 25 domain-containing protein n=2 Tax=Dictyobacter vulcani TaxID=2607529 RepID=A0A5J4KW19_9CHLR|nr:hypothetical protein KDW_55040 [Dictyobacter vulcani]